MPASKIRVSPADWELARDIEVILTKNRILEGVEDFFTGLNSLYYEKVSDWFEEIPVPFVQSGKVSKGEKHEGLPWLMLDYPRYFHKQQGHLAVRSFFWWGHFFSIQLQCSGQFLPLGWNACNQLAQQGWMVGIPQDPWLQQMPGDSWKPLPDNPQDIPATSIIKAKTALDLGEMQSAPHFFSAKFEEILHALAPNHQLPNL